MNDNIRSAILIVAVVFVVLIAWIEGKKTGRAELLIEAGCWGVGHYENNVWQWHRTNSTMSNNVHYFPLK